MTGDGKDALLARLRSLLAADLPLPGAGQTPLRHKRLMATGRENLSLARLAEAHWDAVAILAEAGREPHPGALYGVWASEKPGQALTLSGAHGGFTVSGTKMFASGAGLVDRVLLTAGASEQLLLDVDLRSNAASIRFDTSVWKTQAFQETATATAIFNQVPVPTDQVLGGPGWYVARPGFWHGACGPAACWAGGAAGLLDYALQQSREDPHTLAHLGAIHSAVWALGSYLDLAGREIDGDPGSVVQARIRALTVRHLVEQACTDILRRLPRAYGPYPLAIDEEVSRRYQELDLYLRQSHAERDLESLGRDLKTQQKAAIPR